MGVIHVRLKEDLQDRLTTLCQRLRRSPDEIINDALEQYVSREELKAERHRQTLEALEQVEAGDVIEGDKVLAWIESWGTDNELPPPHR